MSLLSSVCSFKKHWDLLALRRMHLRVTGQGTVGERQVGRTRSGTIRIMGHTRTFFPTVEGLFHTEVYKWLPDKSHSLCSSTEQ